VKITLDIPDELMSVIRKRSIQQSCTVNQVILELVQISLHAPAKESKPATKA
jgi:hypothetical protein